MITFTGPTEVTRDGEAYTEWHLRGPSGNRIITLRSQGGHSRIIDEIGGNHVPFLSSDLGPLAAMLTDAQQYLTGGQR